MRRPELESMIVDAVAQRTGTDRWSTFVELDTCFESIADEGAERLARSW